MLLLLALLPAQAADCVVDRLDTRVSFSDGEVHRLDAWTLGAEPGATGCRWLRVPAVPGLDLVAVAGRIARPDRRRVRFGDERLVLPDGPAWIEPSPTIHLPDADIGSTVQLELTWRGAGTETRWSPGALGPAGAVSLAVDGGGAWTSSGALPGGPAWSWVDVPGDQAPLQLVAGSTPPARRAPAVPVPPSQSAAPPAAPWRIGRVGEHLAIAVPEVGLPVRLVAPGGRVDAQTLRAAGISTFSLATVPAGAEEPASAVEPAARAPIDGAPEAVTPPAPVPGPPGPGCGLAAGLWGCEVGAAGGRWSLPDGLPAPGRRTVSRVDHQVSLRPVVDATSGPDEPPRGTVVVTGAWAGEQSAPPVLVHAPAAADSLQCRTRGEAGVVRGRTCRFPEGPGRREWSWGLAVLPVVGRVDLVPAGATQGHGVGESPGAAVSWHVDGVAGPLESARGVALRDGPGVLPVAEAQATWRVERVGQRAVLPDRPTAIERIALLGLQASMPEPGLPLRFKNRLDPEDMIEDVLSLVRRRVRAAPAVGRGPLSPRPLVSVLRAGWGTAWEQALLLTRYLRQLKLDAVPVPVRPRAAGAGDAASPEGHTAAAVRVQHGGETRWIVPACVLCAIDELPADLHEAPALSTAVERLPAATPGGVRVETQEDGATRVSLDGAAARWLRETLLALRPSARLAAVPAAVGAPGATLRSHEGLAEPGARVVLVIEGAAAGPALPRVAVQGSREVVLPWAGTWQWSPPPPGASGEPFDNGLVTWSVQDGTATLHIAEPVAPREAAAIGLAVARRRLGGD